MDMTAIFANLWDNAMEACRKVEEEKERFILLEMKKLKRKEFYEKLAGLSLGIQGQKVLDVGTGTGVVPRNMYGYGADWTGVDISENQIAYAKQLSQEAEMNIKYFISAAEDIDFPAESFEVIMACQCFMYFDKEILLPKIHRMLKRDGHFAILFMAWQNESLQGDWRIFFKPGRDCGMGKGTFGIYADSAGGF